MNNIAREKSRMQFITHQWSKRSIPDQVEQACRGGCGWIQLRLKDTDEQRWLEILEQVKPICLQYGAFLIINDHVEMALKAAADGVHLGKHDMCPSKARELLGEKSIIGATANTLEDIQVLQAKGIDYLGVGPYRYTSTKSKLSPVLGTEGYRKIIRGMKSENLAIPVIAVGGIHRDDIPFLMRTGLHGIAVSSSLANASDPSQWTEKALTQIQKEVQNAHLIK